jgi:hypothetical protein
VSQALLIIDIQNDYFPGGAMELSGSLAAGRKAEELLGKGKGSSLTNGDSPLVLFLVVFGVGPSQLRGVRLPRCQL